MAVSSFRMKTLDISCLKTTKYKKFKEKRQKIRGKFLLRKKKHCLNIERMNWHFVSLI